MQLVARAGSYILLRLQSISAAISKSVVGWQDEDFPDAGDASELRDSGGTLTLM